jgi:hypothetical protein
MKSAANVGQILNRETKATELPKPMNKKKNDHAGLPAAFPQWLQNVKL